MCTYLWVATSGTINTLSQASVAHDVQTITMALQPAARRLTQRITFTAIDCPTGNNCMGDAFYGSTLPATIGAPGGAMLCRSWCAGYSKPWAEKCGRHDGLCSACSQCFDSQPCLSECDGHAGYCPAAC